MCSHIRIRRARMIIMRIVRSRMRARMRSGRSRTRSISMRSRSRDISRGMISV